MESETGNFITSALLLLIYLLPAINAARRKHHQADAIGMLNVFLGWTVIGWIISLVWSETAVKKT